MKVTLESTDRVVDICIDLGGVYQQASVPARVWEGKTESGIEVVCLITRIAAHQESDLSQFEVELAECRPPTEIGNDCWPSRLVL